MRHEQLVAVLTLEDGTMFTGRPFGAVERLMDGRRGEVVFATSMTGYQEICTDPSYRGQMVVLTYPLIGNYGVSAEFAESRRPWLSALIVREACDDYSNWRATESLDDYLAGQGIPGLCEIDTRALTRHLRDRGTLRGVLRAFPADAPVEAAALIAEAQQVAWVTALDVVEEVSRRGPEAWSAPGVPASAPRVVVVDTGAKNHIAVCLAERGLAVTLAPHDVSMAWLRKMDPSGVLLANGPGDPEQVHSVIALTRELLATDIPIMGICLGHQMLALAIGARTVRLSFGHHGANHPVRDERTGRVTVTSQNHNFAVVPESIPAASGFAVSHVNLSDQSVEGMAHVSRPIFSVQYHPEAAPGPEDNRYLFDEFATMVRAYHARRRMPAALVG
ncbi:MAG TPA: glutamine-hydrolyzing carbamoyl-phosphate synthase small subunit [Ktedonobacterales bacterium]